MLKSIPSSAFQLYFPEKQSNQTWNERSSIPKQPKIKRYARYTSRAALELPRSAYGGAFDLIKGAELLYAFCYETDFFKSYFLSRSSSYSSS